MKSDALFHKNLLRLVSLNPRLAANSDLLVAKANSCVADFSVQTDILEWSTSNSNKIFQFRQFSARSEESAAALADEYKELLSIQKFDQYYDVPSKDPHYVSFVLRHRQMLKDLGINPDYTAFEIFGDDRQLIAFGTGDGEYLGQLLNMCNYRKVVVIVNCWSEIVSSFYKLDWEDVAKKIKDLSLIRVDHIEQAWDVLLKDSPLTLEGSVIYTPYNASKELKFIRDEFMGIKTNNILDYQGFALDELNMIYNSVETLAREPYVWREPKKLSNQLPFDFNVLVCASGPSLDESIDFVKYMSLTSLVIASGSSYETLIRNGVPVDFVCLNERSVDTFIDFEKTRKLCGDDRASLVMSSTCPHQLIDLFANTIVYFRPALSPLALFARSPNEVLYFEGPEAVNTSLAFAVNLNPKAIFLAGVDLGSASLDQVRSRFASGSTERIMELEIPGNKQSLVRSTKSLVDTRYMLELLISSNPSIGYYNYSNGAEIKGARPVHDQQPDLSNLNAASVRLTLDRKEDLKTNLLQLMSPYTMQLLQDMWRACDARNSVRVLSLALIKAVEAHCKPDVDFCIRTQECLDLSAPKHQQIGRRIFRSAIIRACLLVLHQTRIIAYAEPSKKDHYAAEAKDLLKELISKLERESYMLFDTLDDRFFS